MVTNDCLYKLKSVIHKLNGSAGIKKNTIEKFVKLIIYRQKPKVDVAVFIAYCFRCTYK